MKKITSLLLVCLMALVAFNASAVNVSDYVIDEGISAGDVNKDERVNVSDVSALINMILGVTPMDNSRGDVNGDGRVNVSDVTELINIILGNTIGGSTGGSVIHMLDFVPNNLSSYSPNDYTHKWVEGDVIFIAVDPNYQSTDPCQNVYAMVRTGGKWVLRDVNGNNKQGFKTSGGTLCSVYVQHADLENTYYNYIPLTGDVACTPYSANYTVSAKNDKLYITINDILLYHYVSRIDVGGAYEGDYFHESVTHLDALTRIYAPPVDTYSAFETSRRAPVIDIDSNHKGYAYGVWEMSTRAIGWLTLNYTKSNGYAYWWPYSQDKLWTGKSLSLYSPWQNGWTRDLSMRGNNPEDFSSIREYAGGNTETVHINVGSNLILRAYNGDKVDSDGQILSAESSTSGIIDVTSQQDQVSIIAHKMGSTTLTIKHKTKDNITVTYTFNIVVEPTVWVAGKTRENKPILWRNWQDKSMWLKGKESYTSANRVIAHGSTAYVLMRKDVANTYTDYYSGTAAILKSTGAHGGGYFNVYKDGLTGASKIHCKFPKANTTRYVAGIPQMWVDKNDNVYYTSAYRENYTDDYNCYVTTDIYKNKTLVRKNQAQFINDLVTDDSGNIYYCGINSTVGTDDEVLALPYVYLGHATGYLAKLTTSNSLSTYPWEHFLFNRLFVKDGVVYVDAFGFYEQDSDYQTYYWSFGKNVFLRYTASGGLQLYTGSVSQNGFSMSGSNYNSSGTLINPGDFLLEGNKFYYSGGIKTYQLGASVTANYESYPWGTSPSKHFDVKNGYIAMVLDTGSGSPLIAVASTLNTIPSSDVKPMENSTGATIYDVFLQTSLDD